ncbi:MAG: hypothetical protein GY725_24160 [bacterium]|nr:hypothetical protein [bacterium]
MELEYDEVVRHLRAALVETTRNTRGFSVRARGRPELLSPQAWLELAQIEALLAHQLEQTVQRELKENAWSPLRQMQALFGGLFDGVIGEQSLVTRVAAAAARHPVDQWRAGNPQLEQSLWQLFSNRTHYLANTTALALNERAPYPPIVWNPGRRSFSS